MVTKSEFYGKLLSPYQIVYFLKYVSYSQFIIFVNFCLTVIDTLTLAVMIDRDGAGSKEDLMLSATAYSVCIEI